MNIRTRLAGRIALRLAAASLSFLFGFRLQAATITAATTAAWTEYVSNSRTEFALQAANPEHFLAIDGRPRNAELLRSRASLLIYSPHGGGSPIPAGLIHHWIGTVYIPNARIQDLLSVLQDYNAYSGLYTPAVIESKLLGHSGSAFTYRLKFVQKGFGIKSGLLGEFRSTYFRLSPDAGYSLTEPIRLTELQGPGTPEERELTLTESHGYIEDMYSILRYRSVGGGLFVEVDALTLSREVPGALRWLVSPLVQRFSRQTMAATLNELSERVTATGAAELSFTR